MAPVLSGKHGKFKPRDALKIASRCGRFKNWLVGLKHRYPVIISAERNNIRQVILSSCPPEAR
jgi:hypothetical protein